MTTDLLILHTQRTHPILTKKAAAPGILLQARRGTVLQWLLKLAELHADEDGWNLLLCLARSEPPRSGPSLANILVRNHWLRTQRLQCH
jgi:hypothetical protein